MVRSLRGSVGAAGRCVLVIVDHRDRRFAEGLYPSLEVFPRSGWRDWRAYCFCMMDGTVRDGRDAALILLTSVSEKSKVAGDACIDGAVRNPRTLQSIEGV